MRAKLFVLCGMVVLWGVTPGRAQTLSAEETLSRARMLYEKEMYDSSAVVIKAFLKVNGRDPSSEHLVPLLLESLVRLGDDRYSRKLIDIYVRKYETSAYYARVNYLSAVVHVRQEEYLEAVRAFSRASSRGLSPELDSLTRVSVKALCEKSLASEELQQLVNDPKLDPSVHEVVRYSQTLKLYRDGRVEQAQQVAKDFSKEYARSAYTAEVRSIQQKAKALTKDRFSVGLLAPLSGYDADIGKQIVQGVQLAVDAYNRTNDFKINLIISDTRGDMVTTAARTLELVRDHQVSVILGPVLSPTAVVTAAMLAEKDIVMISPTATEDGIAALAPNVFQMNVTMGVLGRKLARYSVSNLTIREFAILAPRSDYGRLLAESFKREVKSLGGEVVAEEWFDEGTNDYRVQFENLRSALIRRRREKESDPLSGALESSPRSFRADSIRLADSILAVGGLFIPAEAEDVVMLAAQVPFYKLRAQLLGATGWHTNRVILDGKQYVNDAIVVTSLEINKADPVWIDFAARYKSRFAAEPDRVAALGYDAAALLCSILAKKGEPLSSSEMGAHLKALRQYSGVSGLVTFDGPTGVNTEAGIVKISKKQFVRLQ